MVVNPRTVAVLGVAAGVVRPVVFINAGAVELVMTLMLDGRMDGRTDVTVAIGLVTAVGPSLGGWLVRRPVCRRSDGRISCAYLRETEACRTSTHGAE